MTDGKFDRFLTSITFCALSGMGALLLIYIGSISKGVDETRAAIESLRRESASGMGETKAVLREEIREVKTNLSGIEARLRSVESERSK